MRGPRLLSCATAGASCGSTVPGLARNSNFERADHYLKVSDLVLEPAEPGAHRIPALRRLGRSLLRQAERRQGHDQPRHNA